MLIKSLRAREILDSNGKPTIEVALKTKAGECIASVPAGISSGDYEAVPVLARVAVENIEKIIAK